MTDQQLRRMNRKELLELLVLLKTENEALTAQVQQLQGQLQSRAVAISQAGTLAQAALQLNAVFESADKAAQHYLENLPGTVRQHLEEAARLRADYDDLQARYAALCARLGGPPAEAQP